MALLFGRYTQVTPIEDTGFPEHHLNSTAYNEVGHRADARDSILTDYIGIQRSIGGIREFGDATTYRHAVALSRSHCGMKWRWGSRLIDVHS